MLMPDKHIFLSESLLGLGSFIMESLEAPLTLDSLWMKFQKEQRENRYPTYHSFENLILATDILFAIGALILDEERKGFIRKCV